MSLNEVRFSNVFIEKRTSHFLETLQQQGFFCLRSFYALMKNEKRLKANVSVPMADSGNKFYS